MTPVSRLVLVVGVVALALTWAWVARRGVAVRRRRATLPAGIESPVLFTSERCASCGRARRVLAETQVAGLVELVWEESPEEFAKARVEKVPVFFWSDAEGRTWRTDGVVSAARLRRWLRDP